MGRVATRLVALVVFALAISALVAPSAVAISAQDYEPPGTCALCHDTLFRGWVDSMHSKAFIDPAYRAKLAEASEATDGALDEYCLKCHIPVGFLAGEIPPADSEKISSISRFGVQCDFCHTATGPKDQKQPTGSGDIDSEPGQTKLGPFGDAKSPAHDSEFSEIHKTSEFCGMCHDVMHPSGDFMVEATYTEWKQSPYAKEGIRCHECHMTPTVGVTPPFPGKAAYNGPTRPDIRFMTFVGANTVYGPTDKATAMLKRAAEVKLEVADTQVKPGDEIPLRVAVTNVGAGHKLPTGLTEIREMWIDVTVADAAGKKYEVARIDESGQTVEGPRMFNTVLENAEGETEYTDESGKTRPVELWDAVAIASDDRIEPRQTVTQPYRFTVPAQAITPLSVKAELKYRSFGDELGEKAGVARVPVVVMAEDSADVAVPEQRGLILRIGLPQLVLGGLILALLFVLAIVLFSGRHAKPEEPTGTTPEGPGTKQA